VKRHKFLTPRTYSMKQIPSWEANRFSASQEIPRILWNPKAYRRIHKCPPPVPILSSDITLQTFFDVSCNRSTMNTRGKLAKAFFFLLLSNECLTFHMLNVQY